jgi:hypothetical protein
LVRQFQQNSELAAIDLCPVKGSGEEGEGAGLIDTINL